MSDGFAEMITAANRFFAELAENNTKEWFEPHKAWYKSEVKKPAELLADLVAEDLVRLTGKVHTPKVFRVNRDVRFSKDKSPYNAHLHLMWRREGGPTWFFGASPSYLIVGMGVMGLSGNALTQYRAFVDQCGAQLMDALATAEAAVGATVSDWGPEPLKRVPKPYDPDHPQGDLLRRKALAFSAPLAPTWTDGVVPAVRATCDGLMPLWRLLDEGL